MRICTVAGCDEWLYARGLCERHYWRMRRHGTTDLARPHVCQVAGCERTDMHGHGLCVLHYTRVRRHGTTEQRWPDVCTAESCDGRVEARGLCRMHYAREQRSCARRIG